jgi:hypothetical protein
MKRKSTDKIDLSEYTKKISKNSKPANKIYFGKPKNRNQEPKETKSNQNDAKQVRINYELSLINKNVTKRHYSPITKNKAKENFEDLIFPLVIKTTLGGKHDLQKPTELDIIDRDYKSDDCIDLSLNDNQIGYNISNIATYLKKFLF